MNCLYAILQKSYLFKAIYLSQKYYLSLLVCTIQPACLRENKFYVLSCPTDNTGDQEGGRLQNSYLDYRWKHAGRTLIVSPAQPRSMESKLRRAVF